MKLEIVAQRQQRITQKIIRVKMVEYGDIVAIGSELVNTYDETNGAVDGKIKGQSQTC
jgi:hypothetical protein